tara:strand:- start:22 stop:372 length:351 start_codon:yes stop_codon:yes gene_type:complete
MDTLNLNSRTAFKKMTEASEEWSNWHEKEIILDEGKKALLGKLMNQEQSGTEKVTDKKAENRARNNPEYKKIVEVYAEACKNVLKSKLMYNNLDRYMSLRQTEVKRDLTLAGKQEG